MSSREFAEWMAFYQIQPFGEWRDDYRMARLAAVITNVMTRTKESDRLWNESDFLPDFEMALDERAAQEEIPEHEATWRKIDLIFGAMTKAAKAKKARKEKS